ncbi:MAG: hypothetical protein KC910_12540 [Candidatus Eremiobacteraeota bacterium]|nr:hypothetical protein [Candidatus Eremiobacteraeota bacterium]
MHSTRGRLALLSLLALAVMVACDSGGGENAFIAPGGIPVTTGNIIVNHVLLAGTPVAPSIDQFRFTGKDVNGTTTYGPKTFPKMVITTLTEVPTETTSLTIEYLVGGAVAGTFQIAVVVQPGQDTIIDGSYLANGTPVAFRLEFVKPPQNVIANGTFSVVVRVLDQFGNPFTTFTGNLNAALASNGAGATLGGTTSVPVTNGVAQFDGLSVSTLATGLMLQVADAGATLPTLNSTPFDVVTTLGQFNSFFFQGLPAQDGETEAFPGSANMWDLYDLLYINDGFGDNFDGAVRLYLGGSEVNVGQLDYTQLSFFGPIFSLADGLIVAAVADSSYASPLAGTYSAVLAAPHNGAICQDLNLTNAVGTVTLTLDYEVQSPGSNFTNQPQFFYVVITDLNDNLLDTAFTLGAAGSGTVNFALTPYAGQQVRLCVGSTDFFPYGRPSAKVDNVSVMDANTTEFVLNGDFETGDLTNWQVRAIDAPQGLQTPAITAAGLTVTRTFYTPPGAMWGRHVDTMVNNTAAPITVEVAYETNLGSDGYGITTPVPGAETLALSTWDGGTTDRDLGWVHGGFVARTAVPASSIGASNGTNDLIVSHGMVTFQPGERKTYVNFTLMDGVQTRQTASSTADRATAIDAMCLQIANNPQLFFDGMTTDQLSSLANF